MLSGDDAERFLFDCPGKTVSLFAPMSQKDIIQGMKDIASAVLPAGAEVLLFGSRVRGAARRDSDWDLLILIDGERATGADFDKYAYPFVSYGWAVGEQINPLIYSFSDWDCRSITPFYKNVQAEGVAYAINRRREKSNCGLSLGEIR